MRIIVVALLVVLGTACQRADPAERSAEVVAARAPRVAASLPSSALLTSQPEAKSCGGGASCCGGGASCGGASCGGSCGGGGAGPTWPTVPAGSAWTQLKVTGMKCGGCARRIERTLATVGGVLGVEIELTTGSVKVATAQGIDARGLVKPAIDALGYQVR